MRNQVILLLAGAAMAVAQGPGPRMMPGGAGGFGGRGGAALLGGPVVTGAPFTGTEVLTVQEKFADGNSVNTTTTALKARDSEGRTYTSETITPGAASGKAPYTRVTIMDPVAGLRYELNSATMTAIETRMPRMRSADASGSASSPSRGASRPARETQLGTVTRPDGAVVTTTSNGTATVNGVLATNTQVSEVIPAGAIGNAQPITTTRTTYVSPDLKLPVQIKTVDPRFGTSDMELTNISTGEPSAALFTVPAGYTIQRAGLGMSRGGSGGRGPGSFGRRGGAPLPQQ